jgi:NodT family efflux transporter outer membrane factor (OMF) lipoprotein
MKEKFMNNKKIYILVFLIPLYFGISCLPSLQKRRHKDLELPEKFTEEEISEKEESLAKEVWTKFFVDEKLVSLIQIAVENNQELSKLEQEIQIAKNDMLARYGEYLPKLSGVASGGIEKVERFSTENANSPTLFSKGGIAMSWEIDIWKKLRNATKSAYLQYLASIEGRRYIMTNLVSEVSDTYYELNSLHAQLQLIEDYVQVLSRIKEIVSLLRQAGRTNTLAVQRFDAEVSKYQARLFEVKQNLILTENRMNLLLGRFPESISIEKNNFLKTSFSEIPTSVPVKLLENRPDVRKANLEMDARKLDVEVARAKFYPSLSIDGELGYEAFNSKHFSGTEISPSYKLAGGIAMPILNRRAIEANYLSANNLEIQAIYNYEQTLLKAFTEVTNQLAKLKNLKGKFEKKEKQVSTLKTATETANTLFKAGRTDYIDVLLTQRDLIEAEIELVEIKQTQLKASIGLYKAIGGGWRGQKEETIDPKEKQSN